MISVSHNLNMWGVCAYRYHCDDTCMYLLYFAESLIVLFIKDLTLKVLKIIQWLLIHLVFYLQTKITLETFYFLFFHLFNLFF